MGLTWCTSKALEVHSGGAQFEYWEGYRLSGLFLWLYLVYSGGCSSP
jgi:hypothetical protein